MPDTPPDGRESISRAAVLEALELFASSFDEECLRGILDRSADATEEEVCAATAILHCLTAVREHGGLDLAYLLNRIYVYAHGEGGADEIAAIAATRDPVHPPFPIKAEEIFACRAILEAIELAEATL